MNSVGIQVLKLDEFEDIKSIDSNNFRARHCDSKKEYVFSKSNIESSFIHHLEILNSLYHPGISRIEFIVTPEKRITRYSKKIYICTEYQKGETLKEWLKKNRDTISKKDLSKIAYEIVKALDYIHKNEIAHGNLTSSNILIREDNYPVLKGLCLNYERDIHYFQSNDIESLREICTEIISPLKIKSYSDVEKFKDLLGSVERKFLESVFDTDRYLNWYLRNDYILGRHEFCGICFEYFDETGVISCTTDTLNSHSVCKRCFEEMIKNFASLGYVDWSQNEGKVLCPDVSSTSRCSNFYKEDLISKHVSTSTLRNFQAFQNKCKAEHLEMKEFIEKKKQRSNTLEGKVEDTVHDIEELLNLKCPRCHQAFIDYSGCNHLTCSRCKCIFCSLCLGMQISGKWEHAKDCPDSQYSCYRGAHIKRVSLKIEEKLNSIQSPIILDHVKKRITPVLNSHFLKIEQTRKLVRIMIIK